MKGAIDHVWPLCGGKPNSKNRIAFCDKLAYFLEDRYLSGEDSQFVDLVIADLKEFQAQSSYKVVLLFPPVNNYLRLLIHKTVEDFQDLHSFSVGEGDQRQTVVCWVQSLHEREQDTTSLSYYPRPQEMRGRGRGRFKDGNSPSPGPGSRHGSGDAVDRWSHDMYEHSSEPGATQQATVPPVQQKEGILCQGNEIRSSPVNRQTVNTDARTTSPACEEKATPNRTRKPERSKNRRPDVQVYVPRARRQQVGRSSSETMSSPHRPDSTSRQIQTGESENNKSFESPDQAQKAAPVRQKKKEIERYIPRGRRQQVGKDENTTQQVSDPSPDVLNTFSRVPENVHKKIRVSEDAPGEPMLTEGVSESWDSIPPDKMKNNEKIFDVTTNNPEEESVIRFVHPGNKSEGNCDTMSELENISDLKHPPAYSSYSKALGETDAENIVHDNDMTVNIVPADIDCNEYGISQGANRNMTDEEFNSEASITQPTTETKEILLTRDTKEMPEIDVDSFSITATLPESQEVYPQTMEHDNKLTEDIGGDLKSGEVYSSGAKSKNDENHDPNSCSDSVDVNTNGTNECDNDLVKCSNDLEELPKSEVETSALTRTKLHEIESETNNIADDNELVSEKLELAEDAFESVIENESAVSNDKACIGGDAVENEIPNKSNVDAKGENVPAETDNCEDLDVANGTEMEEGDAQSAEPMETTETCENYQTTKSDDIEKHDVNDEDLLMVTDSDSKDKEMNVYSQSNRTSIQSIQSEENSTNDQLDDATNNDKSKDADGKTERQSESSIDSQSKEEASTTINSSQSLEEEATSTINSSQSTGEATSTINSSQSLEEEATSTINSSQALEEEATSTINISQSKEEAASTINSSQSLEEEADEDSWDTMFDDDGECLDPTAMEELTKKVGKVKIQKSKKINYLEYQPKDKSNFDFSQYDHIIEIYDFPAEFETRDLIIAFQSFMSRGFDLKWVDDTHALGIFSSAIAARDALQLVHPLLKVCQLSQASKQSQMKARRCTEFLQPYKPRPETSASAARRLVAGALGIATAVPREKREKERQQLKEAKAKKRQERQNRENIWDYGKCAMDEES